MKERALDFSHNDDETLVTYSPDKKKKVLESLNNLLFIGAHLKGLIIESNLKEGFKEVSSKLLESYTTELLQEFSFDSVLKKEAEKRVEKIRALNTENRALRQQLGEKATAEDVRECLKIISEKMNDFWKKEGFQFLHIDGFGPYGLGVTFNTSDLRGMWHGGSECLGKHIAKLKGFGFELCGESNGKKDNALFFSGKNIDVFNAVLLRHFKSFKIGNIKALSRDGVLFIRDIEVYFRDYDELLNMPFQTCQDR
jgi:regulator of replication initiation timing